METFGLKCQTEFIGNFHEIANDRSIRALDKTTRGGMYACRTNANRNYSVVYGWRFDRTHVGHHIATSCWISLFTAADVCLNPFHQSTMYVYVYIYICIPHWVKNHVRLQSLMMHFRMFIYFTVFVTKQVVDK